MQWRYGGLDDGLPRATDFDRLVLDVQFRILSNQYEADITSLALSPAGALAVALADDRIVFENRAAAAAPIKLRVRAGPAGTASPRSAD